MTFMKDNDVNVNTSNTTQIGSMESKSKYSSTEQRVYALARKHFKRMDDEAQQLENALMTLLKKHELSSSELNQMQSEIKNKDDSTFLWNCVVSMKKTEIENIQSKIDKTKEKLKKIEEHPLHLSNRQKFMGELVNSYDRLPRGGKRGRRQGCV